MSKEIGIQIPTTKISSTGELVVEWSELKAFYASVSKIAYINFVEFDSHYYIWLTFRDQKMYVPFLEKGTDDSTDFETNYKAICNIPEAPRFRITTNRLGRKLHSRFITFMTSSQDNFDNTDWRENPYGDLSYIMLDINGLPTADNSLCKETYIDWMPTYNYEVAGGSLYIPPTLGSRTLSIQSITASGEYAVVTAAGHQIRYNCMITISGADQEEYNGVKKIVEAVDADTFTFKIDSSPADSTGTITAVEGDDAWEIHSVGAPDIPSSWGGDVHFIANPRVKWMKGSHIVIDAGLNPAELTYDPVYPTNKIRFVVKHPVGIQAEFQLNLTVYK